MSQSSLVMLQIGLDVVLLLCLLLLVLWLRRSSRSPVGETLFKNTEEFVAASEKLAAKFDQNLREKRVLMNELVEELDQRTSELKALLARADQTGQGMAAARRSSRPTPGDKERKILHLVKEGMAVGQIAARLRLPKGEVETIVSLNKNR
ncbi:MAG: DUF742 domain-containing protein [Deltaproteobacteria bacterium]|nr:DUF742 domain-containing protein [Deltaproteobacteria bacterium]